MNKIKELIDIIRRLNYSVFLSFLFICLQYIYTLKYRLFRWEFCKHTYCHTHPLLLYVFLISIKLFFRTFKTIFIDNIVSLNHYYKLKLVLGMLKMSVIRFVYIKKSWFTIEILKILMVLFLIAILIYESASNENPRNFIPEDESVLQLVA